MSQKLVLSNIPQKIDISSNEHLLIYKNFNPNTSSNIEIWSQQRTLIPEKVETLFKKLESKENRKGIIGHWSACKFRAPFVDVNKLFLIDGQHRLMALQKMKTKYGDPLMMPPVIIHVYEVEDNDEIEKIFFNLNQNTKVDEINFNRDAKIKYKRAFEIFKQKIQEPLKDEIKKSGNPPRESLGREQDDKYIGYLSEICYDERYSKELSYAQLEKQICLVNNLLRNLFSDDAKKKNAIIQFVSFAFDKKIYDTRDEFLEKLFPSSNEQQWIRIFARLYVQEDKAEKVLASALKYGCWIGMFACSANEQKLNRDTFKNIFWNKLCPEISEVALLAPNFL